MTRQEAEDALERGCMHNPWSDDVCGKCAKQILSLFRPGQSQKSEPCRMCSSTDHTTQNHVEMREWDNSD